MVPGCTALRGELRCRLWRGVCLLSFLVAGALLYARLYGAPDMYSSDNLMGEDIYRDLFLKKNPWSQWGLPGAAQYVELALYFGLRFLTGNVHAAMAVHGAVIACLFAFGAAYAVAALFESTAPRRWLYALAPLLAVAYPFPDAAFTVTSKLAHGQTLSAALLGCGFFLRYVERRPSLAALIAATAGMAAMIASDALFTLWFCIPAFAMAGWLVWKRRLALFDGLGWWGMTALAYVLGKALDAWLRNFPVHFAPMDFGPIRMAENLYGIGVHTLAAALSSPLALCWLVAGCLGLAAMLRGTLRQKDGAVFFLLAMLLNALGVAACGESNTGYVMLWILFPYCVGVLSLAGTLAARLPQAGGNAWLRRGGPLCLSLCLLIGLSFLLREAWTHKRPPSYPELVRAYDELARARGLRTGVTGYWDARLVTFLSREGVELIPVEWYGFRYLLFNGTRSMLRDRVDMLIDNPHSPRYARLNRELEIRANGQPDEIVSLPEGVEVLVYRKGAHHPTEAELMLDG